MFDFGDDDKKKLRENMDEIKRLINEGGDAREQPQQNQPDQPEPEPQPAPEQGPEPDFPGDNDLGQETQPAQEQQQFTNQTAQEEQQSFETGTGNPLTEAAEAEPVAEEAGPGTEELEVPEHLSEGLPEEENQVSEEDLEDALPELEKEDETQEAPAGETVFLTVERFESLQDRLEEMRYLTQEVEDVIDHLQAGAEEDSQTADEAQQLLQDFGRRRAEVEDIVLSHEE
ncbi:MAG: hypothetical protein ABEJ69_01120 [Candidatus Nanohaloarchaea archaeon]